MATQKWKCINYGNCTSADEGKTYDLPLGQQFTCPVCAEITGVRVSVGGGGRIKGWPRIAAFVAVPVVALIAIGFVLMGRRSDGPPPPPPPPSTPQPELADRPVNIPGTRLPLRVLTRPFANIFASAEENAAKVKENVPAFSAFFVYTRPENPDSGWYEIASGSSGRNTDGGTHGWIKAGDAIEWKQTLVMKFTHPGNRKPVLFFAEKNSLFNLIHKPQEERTMAATALYAAIEKGAVRAPFPVISMEPKRTVEDFYLLPILEAENVNIDGKAQAVGLKLSAAARTRGATTLADAKFMESAMRPSTPGAAHISLGKLKVDLVFAMDLTSSMQPYVDKLLEAMRSLAKTAGAEPAAKANLRFGFWGYRDLDHPKGEFLTKNYTSSLQPLDSFLKAIAPVKIDPDPSGDYPEDMFSGLNDAVTKTNWTKGAVRVLVVAGDAPSHELGHKWNKTGMDENQLRQIANENNVKVISMHIKDPHYKEFFQTGERQFRKMAQNPGLKAGESAYKAIDASDLKGFKNITNDLAAEISEAISGEAPQPAPEQNKSEGRRLARSVLEGAVVEWVSTVDGGGTAPRDINAWACDRDLQDPSMVSMEVNLLLTKNQLNDLKKTADNLYTAGLKNEMTGEDFFSTLQAVSSAAARDPEKIKNARNIKESGMAPDFLLGLPYRSKVMELSKEVWNAWTQNQQAEFIKEVRAKINYYETIHNDAEQWKPLEESASPGDYVAAIPLTQLL